MPPGPSLLGAALEQAATLLGAPAARVAGAALGTVALVLEPANDPNAPGYDAEKNFSKDHPVLPPDPDAFRLAELEAERAQRALTPDEEAEYIALLAKVKGIHIEKNPVVRDATDEEAAEIAAIRKKHTISKKKNIAYAEGELAGKPYRREAHSGTNSKPGTAETKPVESQSIKTGPTTADIERGVDDPAVRAYDSEVKILEELFDQTADNPNISGSIKIVSERPICESCWDGISQVERVRPNLKIERVQLQTNKKP